MTGSGTVGRHYQGAHGTRLWRLERRCDDAAGGVLLNHGYSEHSGRYLHVIEALHSRGFATIAPDHRGHGKSARLPGDIESVDWVLDDWARCGDALQRLVPGKPIFVLGHSMGAMLSLLLLDRESRWAGAVLNGTALGVPEQIARPTILAARLLAGVAPWLPLQPFYDPHRASRDPEVAARSALDPLQYKGRIRARTGVEMLRAIDRALQAAPRIRAPVLLTHGSVDRTVPTSVSARLHSALGSMDKELHFFDGLLHEVHQEPERDAVIARWAIWLTRHAR